MNVFLLVFFCFVQKCDQTLDVHAQSAWSMQMHWSQILDMSQIWIRKITWIFVLEELMLVIKVYYWKRERDRSRIEDTKYERLMQSVSLHWVNCQNGDKHTMNGMSKVVMVYKILYKSSKTQSTTSLPATIPIFLFFIFFSF